MAAGGASVFGANPDLGRRNFPNPVMADDEGLHGFFMAPAAYRLALANDRARSLAPLEGPMVSLDPSPDVTYDIRRDRAERMDRKRERYLRPTAPPSAPYPDMSWKPSCKTPPLRWPSSQQISADSSCSLVCIMEWKPFTKAGTAVTNQLKAGWVNSTLKGRSLLAETPTR